MVKSKWTEDLVEHVKKTYPPIVPVKYNKTILKKSTWNETAIALWSDFHIGSWYTKNRTAGVAEYSWDIFQKRFHRLVMDTILENAKRINRSQVDVLWILMLGDMVDGVNIYEGQEKNRDRSLTTIGQGIQGSQVVANGIASIAKDYKKVNVLCVPGNHGRIGHPKNRAYYDSFDSMFYEMMSNHLLKVKNVNVKISSTVWAAAKIANKNCVLIHGDQVSGYSGIPAYGAYRAVGRLSSMMGMPIDFLFMGHHHVSSYIEQSNCGIVFNGSLVGGSDLSVNRLFVASRPKQTMLWISRNSAFFEHRIMDIGDPWNINKCPKDKILTPVEK